MTHDIPKLIERLGRWDVGVIPSLAADVKEAATALRDLQADVDEVAAFAAEKQMQIMEDAQKEVERLTDPEYLEAKLNQIGVVDKEWQDRAEAAEARVHELIEQMETDGTIEHFLCIERLSARVKELEATLRERIAHWRDAIRERDELRKALDELRKEL